jgi:hypothetical protein
VSASDLRVAERSAFDRERDADVLAEDLLAYKEAVVLLLIGMLLVLRELWLS